MTKIRRVVKNQYYMKTKYRNSTMCKQKTKYKRKYDYVFYMVQFPKGFDVTDLLERELAFKREGDKIIIKLASRQASIIHALLG